MKKSRLFGAEGRGMHTCIRKIGILLVVGGLCVGTAGAAVILDFEGLQDLEPILDFYSGGTGANGSGPGTDYGIAFGSNALAIIDADAGGSGNFGGEPSPSTTMFFLTGSAVLNMPAGFDTGFSLSYSAINNPGSVVVYDGPNATGNVLNNIELPVTQSDGGDPTGDFSPFVNVGVPVNGTAHSVDFGGTVNQIGFDNITFGSATPGVEFDFPYLVGDAATAPTLNSATLKAYKVTDQGVEAVAAPDSSLPSIILSHGWQPGGDFEADANGAYPLIEVEDAIKQVAEKGAPSFNLLTYQWEDAYTSTPLSFGDIAIDPKLWETIALGGKATINAFGENWIGAGLATAEALQTAEETLAAKMVAEATTAFTKTNAAGVDLASKIVQQLGADYEQPIQFIGHSLGTAVNSYAISTLNSLDQSPGLDVQAAQNTLLDPALALPAFDVGLFYSALPTGSVAYVDNIFGLPITGAAGGPIANTNPGFVGDLVLANHNEIHSEYYVDLINSGQWVSGVFGQNSFFDANYQKWKTPSSFEILGDLSAEGWKKVIGATGVAFKFTVNFGQGALDFFVDAATGAIYATGALVAEVANVIYDVAANVTRLVIKLGDIVLNATVEGVKTIYSVGEAIAAKVTEVIVDKATNVGEFIVNAGGAVGSFFSEATDKVLGLFEGSPAVAVQEVTIPKDATTLEFDVIWENIGDGDWLTLNFNDQLLWSLNVITDELIDEIITSSAMIPEFAGQTGNLFLTLNSVGEVNARVYLQDFRFKGIVSAETSPVPEPATLALLSLGLAGLGFTRRRMKA